MLKISRRPLLFALSALLLMAAMPLASNQAALSLSHYRMFVQAHSRADVRRLAGWLRHHSFDVAGVNLQTGILEVITDEPGVETLQAQGLNGRIVRAPIAGGRALGNAGLDPRYLDPAKVAKRLADLHAKFPSVTQVIEIGRSLNNLPILAMIISTTPDLDDPRFHAKPTLLVDGMHHAREVMSPEIVFDIGETLLGAADHVARARAVLDSTNIVLVPMLNVDGNTRVWNNDTMWRKNARADGSDVFGVDINRNYPYRWAECGGSSGSEGADDYRGVSAASEPETNALMNLAAKIHPTASFSYHSYSELVLYPYGCDGDVTGENELLAKLGKEMADRLPDDSGRGNYTPGTPWQILYAVDGDSMDYLFATYGAAAFTFEINEDFQPSYDLREPTLKKHRVAWQYFLDQMQQRLVSVFVRDPSGQPVQATLDIAQIPHTKGERNFTTNLAGNYFKMMLPGNYSIRAHTANGLSGVVNLAMGEGPQKVTLTVK